jgi:hypothetical protein
MPVWKADDPTESDDQQNPNAELGIVKTGLYMRA